MKNQSNDVDRTNESIPTLERVSYPVVPFMKEVEVTGRIVLTQSNQGHHRVRVFAIEMVKVILAVFLLLAFSLGTASAAEIALPSAVVDAPDCGSQPICGYIQAQRSKVVLFECWYQPVCSYLEARHCGVTGAYSDFVTEILATQARPGYFDVQLMITQSTTVRSGPGYHFSSYGNLPANIVSGITGISQRGDWWVIPLPSTISPYGFGWIEAASAKARNVEKVRVIKPGCRYIYYCQQIWLVLKPDYAAGMVLGVPGKAVTDK